MATAGRTFYDKQLDYLTRKDVDGLIDNNYNEDAVLISFDFTVSGKDALKKHFAEYIENLGYIKVTSTDKFTETEDTIFFEATVETKLGVVRVYDAFYMQNGKISRHFTGMKG